MTLSDEERERREVVQTFVWALTRRHGWGGTVRFERAVDDAFPDSRVGEAKRILRPMLKQHRIRFLGWSESDGERVRLRVDDGRRVELAYYLRDVVGVPPFVIETKLSRFEGVDGGFNETSEPSVVYVDWPDHRTH